MKIYHTETQADYHALVIELEEQGYLWAHGDKPTKWLGEVWEIYEENTCVDVKSNKQMQYSGIDYYEREYPDTPIIKYKAKQEGHSMTPEQEREYAEANNVTKPSHYQDKNGKDLYQKWYEEHDIQTFRAIMRAIAERYISRYEKKNGIEDLKKGIYTLERLREYEEREEE